MTLREIRRRLGAFRHQVLHGRRDRRLQAQAEAMQKDWVGDAAAALPALPEPVEVLAEIHMLCGEKQAPMGLWASWGLMRFLPETRFVLHSDGSITPQTAARWQAMLPGMRLISQAEGLVAVSDRLAEFPHVVNWTQTYHFGFKLGGLHSQVEAPKVVDLDSDVLTLSDPTAFRALIRESAPSMAWNRDHRYSYAYPEALLKEIFGDRIGTLPDRLNGGFFLTNRLDKADWAFINDALEALDRDPRTNPLRYWMHQTLFALLASTRGDNAGPLPDAYEIYMGQTRPDTVVRHYVGNASVRPRFFTEGVPAMIRDARKRGQLPGDFCISQVPDNG